MGGRGSCLWEDMACVIASNWGKDQESFGNLGELQVPGALNE